MTSTAGLFDPERTKVYVMDCRRPFHLANVHAGRHVVVFWDGVGAGVPDDNDDNIGPMAGIPSDGDDLSGQDDRSSSSSDSDDDDIDERNEVDDKDEGEAEFEGDLGDVGMGDEHQVLPDDDIDMDYQGEDEQADDEDENDDDK